MAYQPASENSVPKTLPPEANGKISDVQLREQLDKLALELVCTYKQIPQAIPVVCGEIITLAEVISRHDPSTAAAFEQFNQTLTEPTEASNTPQTVEKEDSGKALGLTHEHLKAILEHRNSNENAPNIDSLDHKNELMIRKLEEMYYLALTKSPDFLTSSRRKSKIEDLFVQAARHTLKEISAEMPSALEARIIASDLFTLYNLLCNYGLDDLYHQFILDSIENNRKLPTTQGEILEIKTNLAYRFLDIVRERNGETETVQKKHSPVTVGVEVEYPDPLLEEVGKMVFTHRNPEYAEKGKTILPEVLKTAFGSDFDEALNIFNEGTKRKKPIPVFDLLRTSRLSSWDTHTLLYDDRELETPPSLTPRVLLRDLITLHKNGNLMFPWNIHVTYSGVELSPEHTEIMDVSAMSIAAGFAPPPDPEEYRGEMTSDLVATENDAKATSYHGEFHYFPFHKIRETYVLKDYANSEKFGVERRSHLFFEKREFPLFVRDLTFSYLACHGIQAVQTAPEKRTEDQVELCKEWQRLNGGWNALLDEYGLKKPQVDGYYLDKATGLIEGGKTPYEYFIAQIRNKNVNDPEFTRKVRKLIQGYQAKVRPIVGY